MNPHQKKLNERKQLFTWLNDNFKGPELTDLCSRVGFINEEISKKSKLDMGLGLLRFAERQKIFLVLLTHCQQLRPDITWSDFRDISNVKEDVRLRLLQTLRDELSEKELIDLFFLIGADHENYVEHNFSNLMSIRELIKFCERREIVVDLISFAKEIKPNLDWPEQK